MDVCEGVKRHPKNTPDGWLDVDEAQELVRLAQGKIVLELGAWKGRSTLFLSKSARYVISVDRHQGIDGHGESLSDYLTNIQELGNVAAVVADFESFVPLLWHIEMVYIDGDHDSDSVDRDTRLALGTGANAIVFHDWDFDEVREGATRVLERKPNRVCGSVASYLL